MQGDYDLITRCPGRHPRKPPSAGRRERSRPGTAWECRRLDRCAACPLPPHSPSYSPWRSRPPRWLLRRSSPTRPTRWRPRTRPAHWLPPEAWVYNHWLPYDEGRLYRVLRITRAELWQQLRDDRRTLAQLAARHGSRPARSSRRSSSRRAPDGRRRGPARAARRARAHDHPGPPRAAPLLPFSAPVRDPQRRAGHLRRHRRALPRAAPQRAEPAGDRPPARPLARRGPGAGDRRAARAHPRRRRRRRDDGRAGPALLRRQLSQLPRWLDQERYNGPPHTHRGALSQMPRDYASNPAISADGRFVAYEAYRQKLPLAVKLGEIAVLRADLTRPQRRSSAARAGRRDGPEPVSAYNPSISGDGARVTYETSAGNQNFAKRYGRIGALLCDLHGAPPRPPGRQARRAALRTRSPPTTRSISADGSTVAYQAVRDGRTRDRRPTARPRGPSRPSGHTGRAATRSATCTSPASRPTATRVVLTRTVGRLDRPGGATSEVVRPRPASDRTLTASRADGANGAPRRALGRRRDLPGRAASSPSRRRRRTSASRRRPRPFRARPRSRHAPCAIPVPHGVAARSRASPRGGRAVAFTVERDGRSSVRVWRRRDRPDASSSAARRAPPAALGDGRSEDPSISADGTRVAFASSATTSPPAVRARARSTCATSRRATTTPRQRPDPGVSRWRHEARDRCLRHAPRRSPPCSLAAAAAGAPAGRTSTSSTTRSCAACSGRRCRIAPRPHSHLALALTPVAQRQRALRSASASRRTPATAAASTHRFTRAGTYRLECELHARDEDDGAGEGLNAAVS